MAIHTGPVTPYGEDLIGLALNETVRIANEAGGGQILASESALSAHVPGDSDLIDLGLHELPDLDRPLQMYLISHTG